MEENRERLVAEAEFWKINNEIEELQGVQQEAIRYRRTIEIDGIIMRQNPDIKSFVLQSTRLIQECSALIAAFRKRQLQGDQNRV